MDQSKSSLNLKMNLIFRASLFWLLLLTCAVCSGETKPPVVAIVSDPSLRNEAALLTTALGNESALQLVEREQMDKILGEQKLAAAGLTRAIRGLA